jgi:hypothetical protein
MCIPSITEFVRLDPPEPIRATRGISRHTEPVAGSETTANASGESAQDILDRLEAERLTPSSHKLREIARKSPPPQDWWDEDFEGL